MEESQKKVTVNIWASVARWPHLSVHFYWMMNNDLPFVSFSCFFPLYSFFGSFHYISRKFVYLLNIATLIKTLVTQTLSWIINAPRCSMCANVIVALPLISLLRQHQSWTKRAVTDWEDERKSNELYESSESRYRLCTGRLHRDIWFGAWEQSWLCRVRIVISHLERMATAMQLEGMQSMISVSIERKYLHTWYFLICIMLYSTNISYGTFYHSNHTTRNIMCWLMGRLITSWQLRLLTMCVREPAWCERLFWCKVNMCIITLLQTSRHHHQSSVNRHERIDVR